MCNPREKLLVTFLVTLFMSSLLTTEAYRILVVFPMPAKSHAILGNGYVRELLKAGHEVTYITPFPDKKPHANLTQIDVSGILDLFQDAKASMNMSSLLDGQSVLSDAMIMQYMLHDITSGVLAQPTILTLIQDKTQRFDVVIAEWFYSQLYSGFSVLFDCPLVWFSSMDVHSLILRLVDDVANPAYLADLFHGPSHPFSFTERVQELWTLLARLFVEEFHINPMASAVYEETFGSAVAARGLTLPPYSEIIYNASLLLANGHPSLGDAPRLPQSVREVGGYHIDRKVEPLPQDLQKLLDSSKEGVIYFSMGSNMESKDLPEALKAGLLRVLGGLKQTVLWKLEEELPGLPKNVHIRKWLPQQSILAHPNTKLFITHGGLLSTTETVHFGVPTVAIPLFGDQFLNAQRATEKGYAVLVPFTRNLPEDLQAAIAEVIGNKSYAETAKRLSSLYHDRPVPPAQEMVYWVEHVVRTRGAPHLRSAALLLPWYSRLYIDLLGLGLTALLLAVVSVVCVIKLLRKKLSKQKIKTH